ncbi:MAG: hypothetical protein A2408_02705 [Candidatus Yonathbacteria bacterium RIFOXYC1_FULL_52_10]|uniref:Glycerate kinase n=1 Tax=Candidatus Yonathbacteria bacterium RIFOXYD1_FULL_52_36 TaxID=1802730 RepID=A0A1G2SND0_9BACT|nr:MAG: hypothetical protein A2408_02705 [Candidatus Yonathbacteria bacterium RIFOXYC1_FULL_52_10]OHA85891.1 MAG: hypothetical protein A2591_04225 [Candidatus Yonathbacteria bacterium RIFOXYD1_FULL_52_36]
MIIQNRDTLATTPLREDALAILEAGYRALDTETVIRETVQISDSTLHVGEHSYNLDDYERIFLIGIGKCAADAGGALERILGDRITDGIIVDVRGTTLGRIRSFKGTHPLPSVENVAAAREVVALLEQATERDLILTVISGGGSALLCLPHDMSCEALEHITHALMKSGATIQELNTVRKHLSDIQGGQFAKLAHPARVVALIFSDVPGDDVSVIASGPTVRDDTTKEDAERILANYGVITMCVLPDCVVTETPKEEAWFEHVDNILVLTNMTALNAMKKEAQVRGYETEIVTAQITGEARTVGEDLARAATGTKTVRLYGGETTVTVRGEGKGGRNQEVVLGGLSFLSQSTVLVAAASDGWDNSEVAGAIGDHELISQAKVFGLDPSLSLNENNSFEFFSRAGGHIITGRRGTNVSDLYFTISA